MKEHEICLTLSGEQKQGHVSEWLAHQAHSRVDLCPCAHVSVYTRLLLCYVNCGRAALSAGVQ